MHNATTKFIMSCQQRATSAQGKCANEGTPHLWSPESYRIRVGGWPRGEGGITGGRIKLWLSVFQQMQKQDIAKYISIFLVKTDHLFT